MCFLWQYSGIAFFKVIAYNKVRNKQENKKRKGTNNMFKVMMNDEATMDEVLVKEFETLTEAKDFITDCENIDFQEYGEVVDELWIEET